MDCWCFLSLGFDECSLQYVMLWNISGAGGGRFMVFG